jgi:GTPase SAR1 family protein
MPFAQLVIGPPGAGKSTYCNGMHQFMSAIGRRCSIVNLDPANDKTSYPCALDVRDLVTLEEIMAEDSLGPNGGVLYALEELEHNIDWLKDGLKELGGEPLRRGDSKLLRFYSKTVLLQMTTFYSTAPGKSSYSHITHPCEISSIRYRSLGTESAPHAD